MSVGSDEERHGRAALCGAAVFRALALGFSEPDEALCRPWPAASCRRAAGRRRRPGPLGDCAAAVRRSNAWPLSPREAAGRAPRGAAGPSTRDCSPGPAGRRSPATSRSIWSSRARAVAAASAGRWRPPSRRRTRRGRRHGGRTARAARLRRRRAGVPVQPERARGGSVGGGRGRRGPPPALGLASGSLTSTRGAGCRPSPAPRVPRAVIPSTRRWAACSAASWLPGIVRRGR